MPDFLSSGQALTIEGVLYRVAEHPAAPGMPYGQAGRAATVYKLQSEEGPRALKVFKHRFVNPQQVALAAQLEAYASLPGLAACRRMVLTPQKHGMLLRSFPDLTYAVVMPWIEGPTWMQVIADRQPVDPEQSLGLARAFANLLAEMEQRGIAHCDLSGPNVILPGLSDDPNDGTAVELVDLEQLYAPGFKQPGVITSGSPGYAHRSASNGTWDEKADRFAGSLLLTEILGWSSPVVRSAAWGESYFDPNEIQQGGKRFQLLQDELRHLWGERPAQLLEQAWTSDLQMDCPTFGQWLVAIPDETPVLVSIQLPVDKPGVDGTGREMPLAGEENLRLESEEQEFSKSDLPVELQTPEIFGWKQLDTDLGQELPLKIEAVGKPQTEINQDQEKSKPNSALSRSTLGVIGMLLLATILMVIGISASLSGLRDGNQPPQDTAAFVRTEPTKVGAGDYAYPTATDRYAVIPPASVTQPAALPTQTSQPVQPSPTTSNPAIDGCQATVIRRSVYLLAGPSPYHTGSVLLKENDPVQVIGKDSAGYWFQVAAGSGVGWLYKDWINWPWCYMDLPVPEFIPTSPPGPTPTPEPPSENNYPLP